MFDEKRYTAEINGGIGLAICEDLNRPTEAELDAMKKRLGMTEADFYGSDDPAIRAAVQLLRAATTAREAKAEAGGR